jgi:hypothetical protein
MQESGQTTFLAWATRSNTMSQPTTIQQPEQTQTPQSNSTWSCCGYWASTQSNESDHLAIIGNDRPTNKNRGKLPSVRIKLVLLGQSGVGKTSLVQRWVFDKFSPSQSRTVGVFNQGRDIEVNGQAVTVTLWYGSSIDTKINHIINRNE